MNKHGCDSQEFLYVAVPGSKLFKTVLGLNRTVMIKQSSVDLQRHFSQYRIEKSEFVQILYSMSKPCTCTKLVIRNGCILYTVSLVSRADLWKYAPL